MTLRMTTKSCGYIKNVRIDEINLSRHCIRKELGDVKELQESIDDCGLLQPVIVRPVKKWFEVVAGNRRFEACKLLGWRTVLCNIVRLDDKEAFEVALAENMQRKTMSR